MEEASNPRIETLISNTFAPFIMVSGHFYFVVFGFGFWALESRLCWEIGVLDSMCGRLEVASVARFLLGSSPHGSYLLKLRCLLLQLMLFS